MKTEKIAKVLHESETNRKSIFLPNPHHRVCSFPTHTTGSVLPLARKGASNCVSHNVENP